MSVLPLANTSHFMYLDALTQRTSYAFRFHSLKATWYPKQLKRIDNKYTLKPTFQEKKKKKYIYIKQTPLAVSLSLL